MDRLNKMPRVFLLAHATFSETSGPSINDPKHLAACLTNPMSLYCFGQEERHGKAQFQHASNVARACGTRRRTWLWRTLPQSEVNAGLSHDAWTALWMHACVDRYTRRNIRASLGNEEQQQSWLFYTAQIGFCSILHDSVIAHRSVSVVIAL